MLSDSIIRDSLADMQLSLGQDLIMLRNMRTALVKASQFERVDSLQLIEQKIVALDEAITAALP